MVKFIFLFSIMCSSFSVSAQTVETIINGQRYICSPQSSHPGSSIRCVDLAYRGPFSRDEAQRLCQGARSEAPAQCALQAYQGPFSRDEAINLCSGAYTTGPSECALTAYRAPFSRDESIQLCGHPAASLATANCALDAYRGPYSKEEAINICRYSKSAGPIESLSAAELEALTIEVNKKAVLDNDYK